MVSLENRIEYFKSIEGSLKLTSFVKLLNGAESVLPDQSSNEIDKVYYGVLYSIFKRDKSMFLTNYSLISKRIVSPDSIAPFVHDDLLIFSLIAGVSLFNVNPDWLSTLLKARPRSLTTITFVNIVAKNFLSNENEQSILIPFLNLVHPEVINDTLLSNAYKAVVSNISILEGKDDFLKIASFRTFDIVLTMKSSATSLYFQELKLFEDRIHKRISILSRFIYNVIIIWIIFGLVKIVRLFPQFKDVLNEYALIVGLVGVTISNFFPSLVDRVKKAILWSLGYKNKTMDALKLHSNNFLQQ